MAIKADHNNREWLAWEPAIKKRKPEAMAAYREKLGEDVEFYKFLQFKFYQQWMPLKEYANRKGISGCVGEHGSVPAFWKSGTVSCGRMPAGHVLKLRTEVG